MARVGIFGGSFDPIHNAHMSMARAAIEQFELDELVFMPTGTSYHKGHSSADAKFRNDMIMLAIEGEPKMSISLMDQSRGGDTYTADTLPQYHRENPGTELFFMLGADSLMNIEHWVRPEDIFAAAAIIAVSRPGVDMKAYEEKADFLRSGFGARIEFLSYVYEDISSSEIRVLAGAAYSYSETSRAKLERMVPEKVCEYMLSHGLYSDEDPWTEEEILTDLEDRLTDERYHHTLGVADTAEMLAERWGVPCRKGRLAGLLHDCGKLARLKGDDYIKRANMAGIELTQAEITSPGLIHPKLGAYYAKTRYHITDEDILSAITWHTTGRPDMTIEEKIVYVADYIEPMRDEQPRLDFLRKLAYEDIDKTIMYIAEDTLEHLKNKGATIDDTTLETYNWYKDHVNKEGFNMQEKELSLKMTEIITAALDSKSGQEITTIDISDISPLADYFIVCHGRNIRQVQALSDEVELKMKEAGFYPRSIEGYNNANWILMDYNDVVVHIFGEEDRRFYDIERIWREGKMIDRAEMIQE